MTSSILTPRLQATFKGGLRYLKANFGQNGLKTNVEIDPNISWVPSFHLRSRRVLRVAAEISDVLYPQIIKEAFADVMQFAEPISVYVVCPLEVFMADQKQLTVARLKRHGIGIITVDDLGKATLQCPCTPLVQNISEEEMEDKIRSLTPTLQNKYRGVRRTYQTNVGQGLQEAGQIIEAFVRAVGERAAKKGWMSAVGKGMTAADIIDSLWACKQFKDHRAELGGARNFIKDFRNTSSHPERTSKELLQKIKKCRIGVLEAVRITHELLSTARALSLRVDLV